MRNQDLIDYERKLRERLSDVMGPWLYKGSYYGGLSPRESKLNDILGFVVAGLHREAMESTKNIRRDLASARKAIAEKDFKEARRLLYELSSGMDQRIYSVFSAYYMLAWVEDQRRKVDAEYRAVSAELQTAIAGAITGDSPRALADDVIRIKGWETDDHKYWQSQFDVVRAFIKKHTGRDYSNSDIRNMLDSCRFAWGHAMETGTAKWADLLEIVKDTTRHDFVSSVKKMQQQQRKPWNNDYGHDDTLGILHRTLVRNLKESKLRANSKAALEAVQSIKPEAVYALLKYDVEQLKKKVQGYIKQDEKNFEERKQSRQVIHGLGLVLDLVIALEAVKVPVAAADIRFIEKEQFEIDAITPKQNDKYDLAEMDPDWHRIMSTPVDALAQEQVQNAVAEYFDPQTEDWKRYKPTGYLKEFEALLRLIQGAAR